MTAQLDDSAVICCELMGHDTRRSERIDTVPSCSLSRRGLVSQSRTKAVRDRIAEART